MKPPQVSCELPMADRQLLESARNADVRGVLVSDGCVKHTLSGGPDVFSVSALALDMDPWLAITVESVGLGPRAEAFRFRILGENDPFSIAIQDRLVSPRDCPATLNLSVLYRSALQPGVLKYKNSMEVEIIPGKMNRIELVSDGGLIFLGPTGILFLVEQDYDIPLNLRISTSPQAIARSVSDALKVVVL